MYKNNNVYKYRIANRLLATTDYTNRQDTIVKYLTAMSHYSIRPQLLQNASVCTVCGANYPTENERDLHTCKDSPVQLLEEPQRSRQRPPILKAISHPVDGQYHPRQDQGQGYGYGYPKTPPQPLFQSELQPPSRQTFSLRPGLSVPTQMQYTPVRPWDQPSPLIGYAPPHVQQETGHSGYDLGGLTDLVPQEEARAMGPPRPHSLVPSHFSSLTGFWEGEASQQKNRRISDPQERETHFGHNAPPNEPDMLPLAKANTPTTPPADKAKVIIIWKKEFPTLEKEVVYADNIQDPVKLAWSDYKEQFQGNATFSQGIHTGSIIFPTSGEMEAVQPFEVKKRRMAISMVTLKLVDVKSPIESDPLKISMASAILEPTKNESEEANRESVSPTEKEKKGMGEQLEQNQELRVKEERIRRMKEEMDCLNKTIDTVKEDKQRVEKEMVKLDEQLIQVMTELSSLRTYGSREEQTLEKENQSLKNELELFRHEEPMDGDELLAAKEQIDQLKYSINLLENTKLQNDRLNEKIQTFQTELKAFQGKEEELEKIKREQQELVNTNKDLHAELNASIRDREELEKKANELKTEVMEKEERMQKESENYEKEKHSLRQEQEELTKNLLTFVDERDKQVNDLVKSKMCIESDLKQARNELKENPEIKESKEQVEHLKKDNSELKDNYSKIEKEKRDLQEQVDGLHTLVNGLKVSTTNWKFKLEYSDKEKKKMKTENAKLEEELAKWENLEKMNKEIETTKTEELEKELESERESSAILKLLIEKLNKEIETTKTGELEKELESERESSAILKLLIEKLNKENETGVETVIKLKEELEQANHCKNSLEYKLEQMSQEISAKYSEIRQLLDPTKNVNKQALGPTYNNVEPGELTTLYSKCQLESEKHQSD